jgi:hypothetical protein
MLLRSALLYSPYVLSMNMSSLDLAGLSWHGKRVFVETAEPRAEFQKNNSHYSHSFSAHYRAYSLSVVKANCRVMTVWESAHV